MVGPFLHRTGIRHPELGLHVASRQSKNRGGLVYLEIRRHHAHDRIIQPVQSDLLSDYAAITLEISLPKSVAQHRDAVPRGWFVVRNERPAQKGLDTEHGKVIRRRPRRVEMFRSFNAGQINGLINLAINPDASAPFFVLALSISERLYRIDSSRATGRKPT